jgi:hypothetical protein
MDPDLVWGEEPAAPGDEVLENLRLLRSQLVFGYFLDADGIWHGCGLQEVVGCTEFYLL